MSRELCVIWASAKEGIIYKTASLFSIFNRVIELSVYIFIWKAVYGPTSSMNGMDFSQMICYYVIAFSVGHLMYFGINEELGEKIKTGNIIMELLYPISYMRYYLFRKIGQCLRQALLVALPTFILASILFQVTFLIQLTSVLQFIVIVSLSIVNVFFIEFIVGMISFVTNSSWGLQILKYSIIMVFSGALAPIEFFPFMLQHVMKCLPFIDFIYTPAKSLLGMVSSSEWSVIVIRQISWLVVLWGLATLVYRKMIKKVTVYGG